MGWHGMLIMTYGLFCPYWVWLYCICFGRMAEPRGLRNNNPSNIRKGGAWKGLAPDQLDPSFCTFVSPEYGIRALIVILSNYAKEHFDTVAAIITRWAPPSENDTKAYIDAVSQALGLSPNAPVPQTQDMYTLLAKAIIQHENGQQPYGDNVFSKAWQLASIVPSEPIDSTLQAPKTA